MSGGEASLASGTREPCHWSEGCNNNVGVTAGNESHNASNARGVTAGKMGRNSSYLNLTKQKLKENYFTTLKW